MSETSNPELAHFTENKTVEILVGPEKHPFYVYKQLLCRKIPYFEICLQGVWHEDPTQPVEVKDVSVNVFRVIMRWVFQEELGFTLENDLSDDKGAESWDLLEATYKAADQLMATELQNYIVDIHLRCRPGGDWFWNIEQLQIPRNRGLEHTPYYQMMLKSIVKSLMEAEGTKEELEKAMDSLNDSVVIFREVMLSIHAYNSDPWPYVFDMDPCTFHIHTEDEDCPTARKSREDA